MTRPALFFLVAIVAIPGLVSAQTFPFEAVVAGSSNPCGGITTPIPFDFTEWFLQPGESIVWRGPSFAVASGDGRTVLGLRTSGLTGLQVVKLDEPFISTVFYENSDYRPTALAQASNGRVFVVGSQGAVQTLLVISATGVLEATYPIASAYQLAVGPDGCTLYFGNQRMNGCTGAPMTPFTSLATPIHDVYPLPDGTALVAAGSSVHLVNAAGTVIRTIPLSAYGFGPARFAAQVALRTDGTLYVVVQQDCEQPGGDLAVLLRIAFDSGVELFREEVEHEGPISSLVLGTATPIAVPAASDIGLLLIGMVIAGAGVLVLRGR